MEKVYRLNNEYRALIRKAEEIRREVGEPSREEGLCYQYAAEKAGQLATMNVGSEAKHWVVEQNDCNKKMRGIWVYLNPNETDNRRETGLKEKGSVTEKKGSSGQHASSVKSKKNDSVSDSIVSGWFHPDPDDPPHGFDDVVGMEDLKILLKNCVRDVSMEALNEYLSIPSVRSFFFYGPPGCGKTFIIEAFVHELKKHSEFNYMKLVSADIHSKFSGEADKIVKRAFEEAVNNAPCILFMDEIDGICQSRSIPNLSDFNMTLTTTFLTSFNDFMKADKKKKNVIFVGATNYPANVDIAMLDRVELVPVPLPDDELRAYTFQNKLEKIIQLDDDLGWEYMSDATEGYNQRDINRISDHLRVLIRNEAAAKASGSDAVELLRSGMIKLNKNMFDEAFSLYKPAPKDEIEKSLNDFENKMRQI